MLDWNSYAGAPLWGPDKSAQVNTYQTAAAEKAAKEQQEQAEAAALYDQRVEKARRARELDDRNYKLEVRQLNQKRSEIAIKKGEAAAEKWYKQESIKLAKQKLQEDARQFNITASGRMDNGSNTLARDEFQDSSLRGWTQDAIKLASTPKDWVSYKRMTSGVADNIGSIPGLNWASGGQVGNTTFQGTPQTNSLGNIQGNMGIGQGAAAAGGWAGTAAQQADKIAQTPLNLNAQEKQLYQTADEFARNPQGAAAGWYENLDPMTRDLLEGAAQAQGHDWTTAMSRYKRSQWGGGGSSQAA